MNFLTVIVIVVVVATEILLYVDWLFEVFLNIFLGKFPYYREK